MPLPPSSGSRDGINQAVRQELARRRLLDFTNHTFPQYKPEPAHALIAETLDRVVSGEITRLMIFAPPQHGKSELTSVRLPAFWLGRRPDDPVILASYGAALAVSKSRQARNTLESAEFGELFPGVRTDETSRAVDDWSLKGHRGSMLAVGVGGPVTGHGAMLGIIDDPFENWAQAQSPTIREHVWDWYRTTFRTRVWEGGAIVIICTRWHDDDLAGRLLRQQGEGWQVLRLPAIAETREERAQNNAFLGLPALGEDPLGRAPGEPLCPGRFSLAALRELRRDVGEIGWAAEYQGVPRPAGGSVFKREWFEVVEDYPRDAPVVRYWDLAGSEVNSRSPDPDWSTGLKMCRTREGVYYIVNVRRARERPLGVERFVTATAAMDGPDTPIWIEQEGGSSGATVIDNYVRRLLAGYAVRADKVANDKMTRAMPFIAQCEAGNVKLVRGGWVQDFLDELETFPNGAHDDQVDTASGAYRKLTPLSGAQQSDEQPDFDHGHMREAAYRQELRPRTVTVGRRGSA